MKASFSEAIVKENALGFTALIPDIKRISPKTGELFRGRDPAETAARLVGMGAPVLSVVTEPEQFGGSAELLRNITKRVDVPILRKDFIKDEEALYETRDIGASAVLLICAVTDGKTLAALCEKAAQIGLEPLVEVHTREEMAFAVKLGCRLIGVNNRDITALEMDNGGPSRTAALAAEMPAGSLLISESGIITPADAKLAASAGANAILVGTALWLAEDIDEAYRSLRVPYCTRKGGAVCVPS